LGGGADLTERGALTFAFGRGDFGFGPWLPRGAYRAAARRFSIATNPWHTHKARRPEDLLRAARANLVVRDGFAAFYFHPFLDLEHLKRTVEGIETAGYRFVDPSSL
jgi:hypothetical protein